MKPAIPVPGKAVSGQEKLRAKFQVVKVINSEFGPGVGGSRGGLGEI